MTSGGCRTFEVDKTAFSFCLTVLYSEERWEAAQRYTREDNDADRLK